MNLFKHIPEDLSDEIFEDIVCSEHVRIERIISHGHTSPEQTATDKAWYDQDEHEWVVVLSGFGELEFEDGRLIRLEKGDYLNIPAHCKHRVSATAANEPTIWLAVFYK